MREIESEIEKKAIMTIIERIDQLKTSVMERNFYEVLSNMSNLFLSLLVSMALTYEEKNAEQYLKSSLAMLFLDGLEMIKSTNRKNVYVMNGEVVA